MRTGNLAEPVWRRSVFRQLNMEFSGSFGQYGADCAVCSGGTWSASAGPMPGFAQHPGHQVTVTVNRLAAAGVRAQDLLVQALLPSAYEEAELQRVMKELACAAAQYDLTIRSVQAACSDKVRTAQYFVTGLGVRAADSGETYLQNSADAQKRVRRHPKQSVSSEAPQDGRCENQGVNSAPQTDGMPVLRPGQTLLMTKWIALAGTAALAGRHEELLKKRFPFLLIDQAKEFEKLVCVEDEARAINHFGACAVHNLSEGGIFCALWEMAERAGVGLEVDLKKIPVKQETIEICEYFDINPYCLYSSGALLVGTYDAQALTAALFAKGIAVSVIGRVTDAKERVIQNGEDRRYLDRPQQEEWYRRIEGAENERTDFNIFGKEQQN